MGTKRVKGDCGECHTMLEDRISQLPDSLIHHIFSSLPTIYLVRMGRLSKRWRRMWVSTPFLYFDDFCIIALNKNVRTRDMVLKLMTYYLRYRKHCMQIPDTFLLSFRFDTHHMSASNSSDIRIIDDWLNFVVKSKVKELALSFKKYCLPQFILNASSLTLLKLTYLKLVAPTPSTFPSLKVLSLLSFESDVKSLQNLISGCPIIEELYLRTYALGPIDFVVSGTLKNLSLSVDFNEQWLNGLISRLPLLERLALESHTMKNISIRSHSLKYVFIKSFDTVEEVALTITTPNLVCLHLTCYSRNIIVVEAPNLLEASLTLEDRGGMLKASLMDLVHLLSNLNFLKKMMLTIRDEEVLILLKSIRKYCPSPLLNLKHLKVKIRDGRLYETAKLPDSLLWCAPCLETLEMV
ncbi:putative F-box/LRR-repeat protein At5g02930 [Ziziphus jujuba]|uniref:F-box/LRR-repeat protein At5g02930 n=1 Tax=Ziziphus jujuba TaxID=326968 RepID=A0ABM4A5G5_ZIZJJ|nr:putative F-box/LRR-repeat protein At5g02930 [Ziziphus jujuba]